MTMLFHRCNRDSCLGDRFCMDPGCGCACHAHAENLARGLQVVDNCIVDPEPGLSNILGPNGNRGGRLRLPWMITTLLVGEVWLAWIDWRWWLGAHLIIAALVLYLWPDPAESRIEP